MKLITLLSMGIFAISLTMTTVPAAAFDLAPPEIDEGPGLEGPGDLAPPADDDGPQFNLPEAIAPPPPADEPAPIPEANVPGQEEGGAFTASVGGGGGLCLFGRWVTTYMPDANGQPIPGTVERNCVRGLTN